MLEEKLSSLRKLLAVNLSAVVVVLGLLIYQNQQIAKNRDTLLEMRKQAETAAGQLTPALDQRLSAFEKRMDLVQYQMNGMDGKIKQAEDRFVSRIDKELPVMLDSYVNKKVEQLKRRVPPSDAH